MVPAPIDLTHTFDEDMPAFPGDPHAELVISDAPPESEYTSYRLSTGMHVGTHMDAPLHMLAGGAKLSELAPARFFGRGVFVDATPVDGRITDRCLTGVELCEGDIVLVATGWGRRFRDPAYYVEFPEIDESFARKLVASRVSIVGLDTPSPDRSPYRVHKMLLAAGVLIIENLTNLESLAGSGPFDVVALPLKLSADAAPVRVMALPREP